MIAATPPKTAPVVHRDADSLHDPASEAGQDVGPEAHDVETSPRARG
jgi:hypothetical protein